MNNELFLLLKHHSEWFESKFGHRQPDDYLFPCGVSQPKDPTRPMLSIEKAWGEMRKRSGVHYSHMRMQAKRVAMDALSAPTLKPRHNGLPKGSGNSHVRHLVS